MPPGGLQPQLAFRTGTADVLHRYEYGGAAVTVVGGASSQPLRQAHPLTAAKGTVKAAAHVCWPPPSPHDRGPDHRNW